jgi:hypothetical protein
MTEAIQLLNRYNSLVQELQSHIVHSQHFHQEFVLKPDSSFAFPERHPVASDLHNRRNIPARDFDLSQHHGSSQQEPPQHSVGPNFGDPQKPQLFLDHGELLQFHGSLGRTRSVDCVIAQFWEVVANEWKNIMQQNDDAGE